MTFTEAGEDGNSMTPVHMMSPAGFNAPWSPGMSGDVTFSPMAPASPADGKYGYQVRALLMPPAERPEEILQAVAGKTKNIPGDKNKN